MANTIFFAWQSDTPSEHNKTFIWEALQAAVKDIAVEASPELSPRSEMDTKGVPGAPNIVDTIFKRIRACSMFVADLTFVGKSRRDELLPNPNVLIELGFAARSIGWDRTILVLNSAHGEAKGLPFDILQHRWPIEYRVTDETVVRDKRCDNLTAALKTAINDCMLHSLERAVEMTEALDMPCLDFIAQNGGESVIDIQLPPKTMGQFMFQHDTSFGVRRLMEIGALKVISTPEVGYAWTHDGLAMIEQVNKTFPEVLAVLREHREPTGKS
jgi:hypothetical protein